MNEYINKTKRKELEFFYGVMMNGTPINNKEELINFRADYFAMCFLLPNTRFNEVIKKYGGYYSVLNDRTSIDEIAKIFRVPKKLVECRIKDILIKFPYNKKKRNNIVDEIKSKRKIAKLLKK